MKIKICGITSENDVDILNESMPDYGGFIFAKSRRQVLQDAALSLRKKLDSRITSVGVFVNAEYDFIRNTIKRGIIGAVQLHGSEADDFIFNLKNTFPDVPVIKAFSLDAQSDIKEIEGRYKNADYMLFDGKNAGSGVSFDWNLLPRNSARKPYFLAGGINLRNINAALRTGAFCLDVSSGAEADGKKERSLVRSLVQIVRNAV